jgi:hypothetical protein
MVGEPAVGVQELAALQEHADDTSTGQKPETPVCDAFGSSVLVVAQLK